MTSPQFDAPTAALIHGVLEWLGLFVGFQVYRLTVSKRERTLLPDASESQTNDGFLSASRFAIVVGALVGAALGNKLAYLLEYPMIVPQVWRGELPMMAMFSGQSIVGGLLGGLIGVELAKKRIGQQQSTGDDMVLGLMLGMVIGRMGCFLSGLHDATYGVATALPWGIDFGDGVTRHPTQLYDMVFVLGFGGWLLSRRESCQWSVQPGLMFKLFLTGYLVWRLVIDSIKPIPFDYAPALPYMLNGIQLLCIVALLVYAPITWRAWQKWQQSKPS